MLNCTSFQLIFYGKAATFYTYPTRPCLGIRPILQLLLLFKILAYMSCMHMMSHVPHVVGAQLYRLSTVDEHTDVLKPIHGKII